MYTIGNDWDEYLKEEFNSDYFKELDKFITNEYENNTIFPPLNEVFNAFLLTPYKEVKVIIVGQDPYHTVGKAMGLAFSVPEKETIPPSLVNIFKELSADCSIPRPRSGSLVKWANNGVLLINSVLTVRKDVAFSHQGYGWEKFTDSVINKLNLSSLPIVFMLWGLSAQKKAKFITNPLHLVIKTAHPSPLSASRGFIGSKNFSKANDYLSQFNREVDWSLE